MVGGEEKVLERVRPLLETEGSRIRLVGPAGAGAATKLANQLMMLSALAGAHEALELAAAHGVSEESVLDVVSLVHGRVLGDTQLGLLRPDVRRLRRGGHAAKKDRPWSKDLFEVVQAARAADIRVPVACAAVPGPLRSGGRARGAHGRRRGRCPVSVEGKDRESVGRIRQNRRPTPAYGPPACRWPAGTSPRRRRGTGASG